MTNILQPCPAQTAPKSSNATETHEVQSEEGRNATTRPQRVSDPDYNLSPMDFLLLEFKL